MFLKTLRWSLSVAMFAFSAYLLQHNMSHITHGLEVLGFFSPLVFLLIYCLASILCLPTVLLVLAGGVLFGPAVGTLLNILGATLGAVCGFQISRHVIPLKFAPKLDGRLHKLVSRVEHHGWKSVALLRLTPAIPYNLVNYSLGFTRIKFSHYLYATMIFLIPSKVIVTYCGYMGIKLFL